MVERFLVHCLILVCWCFIMLNSFFKTRVALFSTCPRSVSDVTSFTMTELQCSIKHNLENLHVLLYRLRATWRPDCGVRFFSGLRRRCRSRLHMFHCTFNYHADFILTYWLNYFVAWPASGLYKGYRADWVCPGIVRDGGDFVWAQGALCWSQLWHLGLLSFICQQIRSAHMLSAKFD